MAYGTHEGGAAVVPGKGRGLAWIVAVMTVASTGRPAIVVVWR
jgi:hypothetical protein